MASPVRPTSRRGLPTAAAVVLMLALGMLGALIDSYRGPTREGVLALCFLLGCVLAALAVRRRNLWAVVVAAPLVFCALALARALVGKTSASSVKNLGLEVLTSLVLGAPALFAATGSALVIALLRRRPR